MAAIVLNNIVKRYDGHAPVIHGVDLAIGDGELVVFVGPSGCGKSTLLRMIAGLEEISAGELYIGGVLANDLAPAKRALAMVFQSYALYPHMTVYDNMAFALQLAGQKKPAIDVAVRRAAAILQIEPLLKRKPKDLSGGQRQRVAIGRAIVRQPEVFLFDEPLSNLDASLRVQMRGEISRLHQELKTTMVYVTHDQVEAMTLGQRIVVFNAGRIEQVGTPHALYNDPANLFVAGFLGAPKMNLIPCVVTAASANRVGVVLPGGAGVDINAGGAALRAGDSVTLGVRAEHLALSPASDASDARGQPGQPGHSDAIVAHVEYLGDQSIIYTRLPGVAAPVAVRQPFELAAPAPGDRVGIRWPARHCLLFDSTGQALPRPAAAALAA